MSVEQAVRILRAFYQDDARTFASADPRALSAAEDLASLLEARLGQESPYVSLWADFQADPEGTATQLTGALEALVEADPAFGRRLEGFVREWRPMTAWPGSSPRQALQDALGTAKVWGTTIPLEADPEVGHGAYLYGNLRPGSVKAGDRGGEVSDQIEGLDHVEQLGLTPSRVSQLRDDLYAAVESHPGLDPLLQRDLTAELEDALVEAAKGEAADAERLERRLRNIERMHPDILRVLLDRLANPESGWGGVETGMLPRE
jgi:hypothetical protein